MKRLGVFLSCVLLLAACAKTSVPIEIRLESSIISKSLVNDLASNASGVYAVGNSVNTTNTVTMKLSSAGTSLWSKTVGQGFSGQIAVDSVGNSYVLRSYQQVGASGTITESGLNLIKYTSSGGLSWTINFAKSKLVRDPQTGSIVGSIAEYPSDVKIDALGNLYVLSVYREAAFDLIEKYVVRKFDPQGKLLKTFAADKLASQVGDSFEFPVSLQLDKSGNVYILTAFFSEAFGGYDYSIIKFDATGKFLLKRLVYSSIYNGVFRILSGDFTLDGQGNIYIAVAKSDCDSTDFSTRICGESKLFIRKLQGVTGYLWTISVDNKRGTTPLITTDTENNVYLASAVYNSKTDTSNLLVAKYDSNGNKKWLKETPLLAPYLSLSGLTVGDGVYVAGRSTTNTASFITKFDKSLGQVKW